MNDAIIEIFARTAARRISGSAGNAGRVAEMV
jgi:hypothetical protein